MKRRCNRLRLPNDSQRHAIYGKTGSGKTIAGLWALEKRSWLRMPWVIIDFKRDTSIAKIPRLEEISITSRPPKQPGLYVVRPLPGEDEEVTRWLWHVWNRGKTGLMFDEVYMIGRFNKAFAAILTQGRSLRIPIIGLSQRPSWLAPFFMSEADFHQAFFVQNPADILRLEQWIPGELPHDQNFHSVYFDVAKDEITYCKPVPNEDEILNRFDMKMPRRIHLFKGITSNAGPRKRALTF